MKTEKMTDGLKRKDADVKWTDEMGKEFKTMTTTMKEMRRL